MFYQIFVGQQAYAIGDRVMKKLVIAWRLLWVPLIVLGVALLTLGVFLAMGSTTKADELWTIMMRRILR